MIVQKKHLDAHCGCSMRPRWAGGEYVGGFEPRAAADASFSSISEVLRETFLPMIRGFGEDAIGAAVLRLLSEVLSIVLS